jgi:hypothetical protein
MRGGGKAIVDAELAGVNAWIAVRIGFNGALRGLNRDILP